MRFPIKTNEAGFVMVWGALMITVLLAMAGMAIDLANWYLHIERSQRAADSAALAGAPYLPTDVPSAKAVGKEELAHNGVSDASVNYIGPDPTRPAYMKVTLTDSVDSYFLQFLGIKTFTYERSGIAHFQAPVAMGSNDNTLGRQPPQLDQWSTTGTNVNFVLAQNSSAIDKRFADRWDTYVCAGNPGEPDYCSNGVNDEYRPGGLEFVIDVSNGTVGTLAVEVYDPLVGRTEAQCDTPWYTGLQAAWPPATPFPINYASYAAAPELCVGDQGTGQNATFSLWAPNATSPINTGIACQPRVYPPLPSQGAGATAANWASILSTPPSSIYDTAPANTFHKWTRVCTLQIDGSVYKGGKYILKSDMENSLAYQIRNRYGIRAAILTAGVPDLVASKAVKVYGPGKIVTVVKDAGLVVSFRFARVPQSYQGSAIHLQTYDLGEAGQNEISFAWSDGSPVQSCRLTWPGGGGPNINSSPGCVLKKAQVAASKYNSRVADFAVDIPAGAACPNPEPDGCWIVMTIKNDNVVSEDGSSWSIDGVGTPLRLYNQ